MAISLVSKMFGSGLPAGPGLQVDRRSSSNAANVYVPPPPPRSGKGYYPPPPPPPFFGTWKNPIGMGVKKKVQRKRNSSRKKQPIQHSIDEIQNRSTVLCGYWCLYYLYERQKGDSILDIIHSPYFDNDNSDFIKAYFEGIIA